MTDHPEALRLAGQFERSAESLLKLDQMIGQETRKASQYARAAAELRYQHSRIEADEALMRQMLRACGSGSVTAVGTAIIALRTRLEQAK